jgi:putative membrane protein
MSTRANYDVGRLAGDVGWAQGRLDDAIAQLEAALTQTQDMKAKLEYSRDTIVSIKGLSGDSLTAQTEVTRSLETEIQYLIGMSDQMQARLDALKALSNDVRSGAASVSNLSSAVNNSIQTSASALSDVQGDLSETTIPAVDGALDDFSQAASGVSSVVAGISPALEQVSATLDQLDQVLAQAKPALASTRDSVSKAADTLAGLESDVAALQTTQAYKDLTSVSGINPDVLKNYFTSPVELSEQAIYPVRNYGSGVTPFYTDLALWVGGFVLVAIYKREVDDEGIGEFKPWQGYVGRALLFSLLGEVQAIICCVGDLALGIQCLNPVAFVFAGMVESFVYVNIVFSLSTGVQAHRHGARRHPRHPADPRLLRHLPHRDDARLLPGARAAPAVHVRQQRHARGHRRLLRQLLRHQHRRPSPCVHAHRAARGDSAPGATSSTSTRCSTSACARRT